jgi:glycerol uptake facilitator-like aquaporin
MFGENLVSFSRHVRSGPAQMLSEFVATSFANPAVTIARSLTETFAGIRPSDVPGFIAAQCAGAGVATLLFRWLVPALPDVSKDVVVPHGEPRR